MCGNTTKAMVTARWGGASYQAHRNDWQQNGHDSFLVEAGKYGLGRRDLAANVNWFSKVGTADDGRMLFDASAARAGATRRAPLRDGHARALAHVSASARSVADLSAEARDL